MHRKQHGRHHGPLFGITAVLLGIILALSAGLVQAGTIRYEYDPANNNLLAKTVDGLRTEYGNYDANGNPGYQIEAAGTAQARRTDYTYDPRFHSKVASRSEPSVYGGGKKVTTYTYDAYGNATQVTIVGYTDTGSAVSRSFAAAIQRPAAPAQPDRRPAQRRQ